ncbi:hypothetical protein Tco_0213916 [Tanacetum coccineum]
MRLRSKIVWRYEGSSLEAISYQHHSFGLPVECDQKISITYLSRSVPQNESYRYIRMAGPCSRLLSRTTESGRCVSRLLECVFQVSEWEEESSVRSGRRARSEEGYDGVVCMALKPCVEKRAWSIATLEILPCLWVQDSCALLSSDVCVSGFGVEISGSLVPSFCFDMAGHPISPRKNKVQGIRVWKDFFPHMSKADRDQSSLVLRFCSRAVGVFDCLELVAKLFRPLILILIPAVDQSTFPRILIRHSASLVEFLGKTWLVRRPTDWQPLLVQNSLLGCLETVLFALPGGTGFVWAFDYNLEGVSGLITLCERIRLRIGDPRRIVIAFYRVVGSAVRFASFGAEPTASAGLYHGPLSIGSILEEARMECPSSLNCKSLV